MKYLGTLLMLMCISTMASAQLLKEDFDYPAGDSLRAHGWLISGTSTVNTIKVASPALTFTGYSSSGVGNSAPLANNGQDVYKIFADDSTGSVYFSFMFKVSAANTTGDYFLAISPAASQTNYYARTFIKSSGAGFVVGVSKSNETAKYGTTVFTLNTTYLAVVKYSFAAGVMNDTISVYVLPDGTSLTSEPSTAEISKYVDATKGDATDFNSVTLRQGSNTSAPTMVIDGIRIARSWANSAGGIDAPTAVISTASINFGRLNVGSTATDSIKVKNTGYAALTISSVTSNVTAITVTPSNASVAAFDSAKFVIKYAPAAAQTDSGSLAFVSNASSSPDTVIVKGQGKLPGFSVTPASLDFGKVWKDSTVTDTLFVSNKSTTDGLVIDSVVSSDTTFTVSPKGADLGVSASDTFLVSFKPHAKGLKSASLVFFHDIPVQTDTVKLSGNCIEKVPAFLATPDSLDFHGVLAGKSKTDTIVVKNAGYDSLFISSVTSSNSVFTVTPATARIDTMATKKFVVTFTPGTVGIKTGAIVFQSNAAEGKDTVWAKGSGSTFVTISEARKDANSDLIPDHSVTKDTLFVTGVITSPNVQTSPQSGYFMQDATAGIEIFSYDTTPSTLSVGDSVFVIGYVAQYHGLTEFTPLKMDTVNFKILKHNATLPKAKVITAHEFVTNPEASEGSLIEIDSLYYSSGTWPAEGANGNIYFKPKSGTDSVQIFVDKDTQVDGTPQPADPVNFKGILSQYSSSTTVYNDGYELIPRDTNDIKHVIPDAVTERGSGIPREFYLHQNYPNPFNPATMIEFGLPKESEVQIAVYNVLGQRVALLVDGRMKAGNHKIAFNAGRYASGVYFYVMRAGEKIFKQKMLLMK